MTYNPAIHNRRSTRLPGYDYSQSGLYFLTICTAGGLCLFGEIIDHKMVPNAFGSIVKSVWNKLSDHYPGVIPITFVVMPNHVHGIINIRTQLSGSDKTGRDETGRDKSGRDESGRDESRPYIMKNTMDPVGAQFIAPYNEISSEIVIAQPDVLINETGLNRPIRDESGRDESGRDESRPYIMKNTMDPVGAQFIAPNQQMLPNTQIARSSYDANVPKITIGEIVRGFKARCTYAINQLRQSQGIPVWQRNYHDHIIRDEESYLKITEYIQTNPLRWKEDPNYA